MPVRVRCYTLAENATVEVACSVITNGFWIAGETVAVAVQRKHRKDATTRPTRPMRVKLQVKTARARKVCSFRSSSQTRMHVCPWPADFCII